MQHLNLEVPLPFFSLLFQLSIDLLQFVPTLKFEYRIDGKIGPEESDGSSMCVLNRLISYDKKTGVVRYEADPPSRRTHREGAQPWDLQAGEYTE